MGRVLHLEPPRHGLTPMSIVPQRVTVNSERMEVSAASSSRIRAANRRYVRGDETAPESQPTTRPEFLSGTRRMGWKCRLWKQREAADSSAATGKREGMRELAAGVAQSPAGVRSNPCDSPRSSIRTAVRRRWIRLVNSAGCVGGLVLRATTRAGCRPGRRER